jgi:murein DD-endopeptidase MepM/ murein hydrolase activator NlpD
MRVFGYFGSVITFCLISLVFIGVIGVRTVSFAQVSKDIIDDKKDRKDEISDEKSKLQKELNEKRKAKQSIVSELLQTDRDLDWTQRKLIDKEKELDRRRKQKEIVSEQLAQAESDLEETQTVFEERLRVFYKTGASSLLSLIVDAKNLSDLTLRIRYTEKLLTFDEDSINSIQEQQDLLAQKKTELSEGVREYEQIWREIEKQRTEYQKLHNKKSALKNDISKDIRATEELLQEIIREETEIDFFLEAAAKGNLSTNFDGTFSKPIGKSYTVSSGFGMRVHPIFKRRKMHTGIDLSCPEGTPVLSAGAGRVIFAGWKTGYGNTIMIDHGRGYSTLYGHMSMILASVGQDVMEGQPIGKVGSTGVSTGDHLHFEIRLNGKPRNPTEFLSF